jgi:hypothetical protein
VTRPGKHPLLPRRPCRVAVGRLGSGGRVALLWLVSLTGIGTADGLNVGGVSPVVTLSAPPPGYVLVHESDASSTISYSTDAELDSRKITVEIDDRARNFAAGLRVEVSASPGVGEGTGHTAILTTKAADLITDIGPLTMVDDLPLTFRLIASLDAPPGSDTRTILFTILSQ